MNQISRKKTYIILIAPVREGSSRPSSGWSEGETSPLKNIFTYLYFLSKLMNSIESLQNRGKGAAVTRKHGYRIDTSSIKAQHAAEEMMLQIENDMKTASAKLAAEQAERMVKDSITASMERIDSENENMRTWEENMVRRSGYHVDGKSIHRDAVVDSSLGHTYYEGQSVHYYEDFYDVGPKISVSFSKEMLNDLTSSAIMLLVEQANLDIENWTTDIFGKVEKDDEGNSSLKQNYIARDSGNNSKIDAYKKLAKKDYDSLSESEQNEFNDLSELIVTVRDGKLGEWIGYAPQFKNGKDNSGNENKSLSMDLSKGRDWNVKHSGSGQMGKIMLDFQWNNMIEQQGWQKVALPAYDQPLWRGDGGWFEPPTIRGVASIVFEVVGQASGQTWFSYADDVIFAVIDLGGGFKSPEQVGLDLAKTAATAVISCGCSAAGSAIGNIAGKAMEGAGKFANFAAQAGISAATTYVSTVATSAVNNVQLGADGGLTFNKDEFGKSLYSASTIAGAVGAGFTAGLNEISVGARTEKVKNPKTGKMENQVTYTRANGLSSAQIASIQSLNGLAGGLVQNGISLAMGGDATFNILDFADIAGMFGKEYKNGKTGAKASTGLLEVSFGQNGFKSRIGMGGTNISVNSLLNSMNGAKDWDKSEKINDYVDGKELSPEEKKKLADALRMQYGFGDTDQLKNLDDILSGKTSLGGTDTDGKAQTVAGPNDTKTIMMAMSEGMDWKELGLLIGHEAYRDGIVSDEQTQKDETREAVKGHTEMAEKMLGDVLYAASMSQLIDNNQNLQMDLLARALGEDFFNAYIDGTYDSSADYWLIHNNGSVSWDGNLNLYVEKDIYDKDGNLIINKKLVADENGNGIIRESPDEAVNYRQLQDLIDNANGDTVNISGINVKVERLKEIAKANEYIVSESKNIFGNYTSYAAEALLSDGYMSYEEATISEKSMFARSTLRMYEKTAEAIASKFLFSAHDPFSELEGIKSFLDAVSPNIIEHYSTRYVLNQNDEFKNTFDNMPDSTFKNWTTRENNEIVNYFGDTATLLPPELSRYHGNCLKYTLKSGREIILQADPQSKFGYRFDTNESTFGTYNYSTFAPVHFVYDMWPYYKCGNTPFDMYNTDINRRIHPDYQAAVEKRGISKESSAILNGVIR